MFHCGLDELDVSPLMENFRVVVVRVNEVAGAEEGDIVAIDMDLMLLIVVVKIDLRTAVGIKVFKVASAISERLCVSLNLSENNLVDHCNTTI